MTTMNSEDRLILVSNIEANPLRDFDLYPIKAGRTDKLGRSYAEGDFGTIIPVRPHPVKKGIYQQACGHHRLAAMRKRGYPLKMLCRISDLSDEQMASIMVRENMNNYGNNPEAVADSVAAICKVLIYQLFLSESRGHLSQICERLGDLFESDRAYDTAKAQLVRDNTIGEPLISRFFGMHGDDCPLSGPEIKGGLASLKAAGMMEEICRVQRAKVDRVLAAKAKAEREAAAEAERKLAEAAAARKLYEEQQAEQAAERKRQREEAKKLKDEAERKEAEAKIAADKANADKERRRQVALEAERKKLEAEAERKRKQAESTEAAKAKVERAEVNAQEKHVDPWLHIRAFGMFKNQGQFDAFRQMMAKPEFQRLFPVDQQPEIIAKMIEEIGDDKMTAANIKLWMTNESDHFKKVVAAKKRAAEKAKQEAIERNNIEAKAERIMGDLCATLAKLSRNYNALHEANSDPKLWEAIMASPYATTVRSSLESQYRMLPELERFFDISARQLSDTSSVINQ